MITTAALSKTVFLVILGCTGDERVMNCPESVEPQSWTGPEAKEECETYIHNPKWHPKFEMPGQWDYWSVRCE